MSDTLINIAGVFLLSGLSCLIFLCTSLRSALFPFLSVCLPCCPLFLFLLVWTLHHSSFTDEMDWSSSKSWFRLIIFPNMWGMFLASGFTALAYLVFGMALWCFLSFRGCSLRPVVLVEFDSSILWPVPVSASVRSGQAGRKSLLMNSIDVLSRIMPYSAFSISLWMSSNLSSFVMFSVSLS